MEEWTNEAIETLEEAMRVAGAKLVQLGNTVGNTAAAQKTKVLILGFIEEVSQVSEQLYKSTKQIINIIKEDGLHIALAEGIDHFGDTATHFVTETFLNEIGGEMAKLVTIPVTTVSKGLGMDDKGASIKAWFDNTLRGMSQSIDDAMTSNFTLLSTLFRDPEQFARMIEREPWRLAAFINPVVYTNAQWQFTWAEDQISDFFEYDSPEIALPEGWITDL